jgi:hypothetical protein
MEVAVKLKRVMASVGRSSRGEQELVAEVNSISKLSHRNLVKLVGWCHERGELMLHREGGSHGGSKLEGKHCGGCREDGAVGSERQR